jgi:hypothetical protein
MLSLGPAAAYWPAEASAPSPYCQHPDVLNGCFANRAASNGRGLKHAMQQHRQFGACPDAANPANKAIRVLMQVHMLANDKCAGAVSMLCVPLLIANGRHIIMDSGLRNSVSVVLQGQSDFCSV